MLATADILILLRGWRLLRPLNMAEGTPGKGVVHVTNAAGGRLTVINVMANLFMAPNDPVFPALDGALVRAKLGRDADFILVDAHGEATSEKMALGHLADGRASMLVGTHTHYSKDEAAQLTCDDCATLGLQWTMTSMHRPH